MMFKHLLSWMCCVPLLLAGCAQTVEITSNDPTAGAMRGIQRIAVLDMDGPDEYSAAATQRLVQRLRQSGLYEVVDERALQQSAPEQLRDENGKLRKSVAGEAGRRMHLHGLIVSTLRTRDSRKEMQLRFGSPVASATTTYTWIELPSGRLRDSHQAQHAEPTTSVAGDAIQVCMEASLDELTSKLAPNLEIVSRELAGSSWFNDLSKGNRLAAANNWQEAEASWNEVARDDPDNDGAWYNLGIAAEARGDRQQALDRYQRASQITDKGEYRVALQRVSESLQAEQLARQQYQHNVPDRTQQQRHARQPNQPASYYSGHSQFNR